MIIVSRVWSEREGLVFLCGLKRPFIWSPKAKYAHRFDSEDEAKEFVQKFWATIPEDVAGEFIYEETDDASVGLESRDETEVDGTTGVGQEGDDGSGLDDTAGYGEEFFYEGREAGAGEADE